MSDERLVTGEELFRLYKQYRQRDQVALMRARRHHWLRQVLVFVSGITLGGVLTAIYFMEAWK